MSTLRTERRAADDDRPETAAPQDAAYDRDFFLWTERQAAALREGRWDALDVENLVDEVESLGRSEKREIRSRLLVISIHLLKWRYQPEQRLSGWRGTIIEQRRRLREVLEDSPSLKRLPGEELAGEYGIARLKAAGETDLPEDVFPSTCPFTIEQVLDDAFYPEGE